MIKTSPRFSMTRINLVPVTELSDQHLMAEYRELPMVARALERTLKLKASFNFKRVSQTYTLNAGHVYFFYNKATFLSERWQLLIKELRARNFDIHPTKRNTQWLVFESIPQIQWKPTSDEIEISRARIRERLIQRPGWYRWTSVDIKS